METEIIYIAGFNAGYLITKYQVALAHTILTGTPALGSFLQGFVDGKEQLEFENTLEQLHQLSKIRNDKDERDWNLI